MGKFALQTTVFHSLALATVLASPLSLRATVTFEINSAELLKDENGVAIPAGTGLFILAASRTGGFDSPPNAASFFPGDEIELGRWAANTEFGNQPGILFASTGNILLENGLEPDDQVGLFWFPSLSTGTTVPGANVPYGFYRDPTGIDGGEPWTVPADGDQRLLRMWTSDSDPFAGSVPASAGEASNLTAVPEPQTWATFAAATLAGFAAVRRFRARAR